MHPLTYWALTLITLCTIPFSIHLVLGVALTLDWQGIDFISAVASAILALVMCSTGRFLQRPYIFAHEMAHALAVLLTGGRIHRIHVGRDQGFVEGDRATFFVRLAPYLLPLAPLSILGVYYPTVLLLAREWPGTVGLTTHLMIPLFTGAWVMQGWYNTKLFFLETTDVERREVFLSVYSAMVAFLLGTAGLFYLAYGATGILRQLPKV